MSMQDFPLKSQKVKTLSLTHQPNKKIEVLKAAEGIAAAEIDKPRIATTVSIGRRRPIITRHRIWKIR
jgi:hypothetical protein